MSTAKQFEIKSRNDDLLKGLFWPIDKPEGYVIIMEGMEEYCRRYDAFAKFLNEQNLEVYALDTFGQGENVLPDMSNVGLWPKYGYFRQVDAVDTLVCQLKEKGLPVYLFSHSMGSFMCQTYIQSYSKNVDKVILCGSGSKNPIVGLGFAIAKMVATKRKWNKKAKLLNNLMFGNLKKGVKNAETDYDWLSVNKENVKRYIADPLCGFGPTNGFCLEFVRGMKPLHKMKNVKKVRKDLPIFIISGEFDPVTNFSKSVGILKDMYNKAGLNNVSTKIYTGLRHEILNEDHPEVVYQDVINFLKA